MLNRVGKERLLGILQSDRFDLYDPDTNGGLWVGKEYGKSPAFKRDPLHNLSHGATAMQTARFYYLLETGQLVDNSLSREMKAMLGNPGIKHKFVKGLTGHPDARIFRKSGSWRHWHADSAIVETAGHKYIIVGLAEDASGGAWLSRMIQPIHEIINPTTLASTSH
jgi:beta-lactamase class A